MNPRLCLAKALSIAVVFSFSPPRKEDRPYRKVQAGIVYFNVDHVVRVVLDRVQAEGKSLRLVVGDLSTSPPVDLAGARMFLDLHTELAKRGVVLRLAGVPAGTVQKFNVAYCMQD